jgi:hypothetical protein
MNDDGLQVASAGIAPMAHQARDAALAIDPGSPLPALPYGST